MIFNGITYLWERWREKSRDDIAQEPPKHIIIPLNQRRANDYCRSAGVPPRGRHTYILSTAESIRGLRINPQDTVVVLNDASLNRNYSEIRENIYLASITLDEPIDIDTHPLTYA